MSRPDLAAPPARRLPLWAGAGWWLAVIVLIAMNLRIPIASVPPLADVIGADLGLTATGTGLLTTLPVLCMGLFAPVAPAASARYGRERVLAAALGLIVVGTGLRLVPATAPLFLATALFGIGIAVAGTLLPPLVRERYPRQVGPVTGLYTAGLIGGAMVASSLVEPLRTMLDGSWPKALGVWAILAALAVLAWLPIAASAHSPDRPADAPRVRPQLPWRDRTAWLATLYMGSQSLLFYGALAWLAARYTALGMSAATAGLLLGVFSATQLVTALGLPALAHRTGTLRPWIAFSAVTATSALAAIALVPSAAPWVWSGLLGVGVGGQFALALTLIGSLGRNPTESGRISGMAFFVGYLLAATGPVAAGALRDLTGDYRVPFLALAAVGVAVLIAGLTATRRRPGTS